MLSNSRVRSSAKITLMKLLLVTMQYFLFYLCYLNLCFIFALIFAATLGFRYKHWQKLGNMHRLIKFCIAYHYIISIILYIYLDCETFIVLHMITA